MVQASAIFAMKFFLSSDSSRHFHQAVFPSNGIPVEPQREQLIIDLPMLSELCRRRSCEVVVAIGGLVAVASLLVGCGIPIREFPITYVPQQNVQAIPHADAISVEVKVEDLQPAESLSWDAFNPISQKVNFRVKDAGGTVKGAAETELRARGFKIGSGEALVTIQLDRFEALCEYSIANSASSDISMRVQVEAQTGKVLYSKVVKGEVNPTSALLFFHTLNCATPELQGSLADAFRQLFADPAFTAAILATRQPPPAKPVVSPGRIAGAYATMSRR
jgi:uncharacterized lipoprotein YajG